MRLFLESFARRDAAAPNRRDDRGVRLEAVLYAAALLALMMAIIVGPTLNQVRATHATDVAGAVADALQFKGPAIFLAP